MSGVLAILAGAVGLVSEVTALIQRLQSQGGREPTAAELESLRLRREEVEAEWAKLAPADGPRGDDEVPTE